MNGLISSLITFVGMVGMGTAPAETFVPADDVPPPCQQEEVLWLARVTFSETKVVEEMPYIAWVVRNRVDTGYMGTSYKEVALYPNQFSGLNIGDEQYHTNISLNFGHENVSWKNALAVAADVCQAPDTERLFPETLRHFYSPRSVAFKPTWAHAEALYYTIESPKGYADRFAFYDGIK
jgi:hypothetical protein